MKRVRVFGLVVSLLLACASCRQSAVSEGTGPLEVAFVSGGGFSGLLTDRFFVTTNEKGKIEGVREGTQIKGFYVPRATEVLFRRRLDVLLRRYDWEHMKTFLSNAPDARFWELRVIYGGKRKTVTMLEFLSEKDGSMDGFWDNDQFVRFRLLVSEIRFFARELGFEAVREGADGDPPSGPIQRGHVVTRDNPDSTPPATNASGARP